MTNLKDKYIENAQGEYYVDESCITCGLCVSTAPYNFTFTYGDKHAYVIKQPDDPSEETDCRKAMEGCPVDAIGNDG